MQTTNYEIFKILNHNRSLQKATNLKQSMKIYGFLKSKPITVNENFEVIDGQHRLMIAKELGLPVVYEIEENIGSTDAMILINTSQNTWRLYDYVHYYAKQGVKCYVEMYELYKHHSFNISDFISIYTGSTDSASNRIKSGYQFTKNPMFDLTIELLHFFNGKLQFRQSTEFTRGVIYFLKQSGLKARQVETLKRNAFSIIECAKAAQYLAQFNKLTKFKPNAN